LTITDKQLLEGCLAHHRGCQRRLFELYKTPMYSVVYRILNDEDHAHDALQEGFIDVFRDLKFFRRESTLRSWIKIIMVRKALKKLKSERRYAPLDALPDDAGLIAWPDDLSGEALDEAIRSLSPRYRAVFTLIEVEGYSHQETAALLEISEGTSKSQLHHAKKILRSKLAALYR
jgi:RNA polymerase sigma-70 factor (ECF subfamily)